MFDLQHVYTVAIMALVFAPLELLLPARKGVRPRLARYSTDLLHAAVGGFLIRIGTVIALVLLIPSDIAPEWIAGWPVWLQFIAAFLISDLMFWIAHRVYHAVPFLWRFHRIHHSSEHLDWLASFRVHPVDQIINAVVIAAPTLMLGFSPAALLVYVTIYKWHAILLHSNVRIDFGPLDWLIVTPRFHHWHHANQHEAHDRNFGGQLTIWDQVFGTYYRGPTPRPDIYGVDNPPPENFVDHLLEPFNPRRNNG